MLQYVMKPRTRGQNYFIFWKNNNCDQMSLKYVLAVVGLGGSSLYFGSNPKRWEFLKSSLPTVEDNSQTFDGFTKSKWNANWDQRQPDKSLNEKPSHRPSRHMYLIRHGQYDFDSKNHDLTALGREQAKMTGQRLKDMGIKFHSITSSTMPRAIQTCDIISKELKGSVPVSRDSILEEGACFPPEPPHPHYQPTADEFLKDHSRIEKAFQKFMHRAESDQKKSTHEALVCHGNVIRYFVCRTLQVSPDAWLRMNVDHASITLISIYYDGRISVRAIGNSSHFPPEMQTA